MKELTVLEYNNKRILTTKQLAEVYETAENNIINNFNNKNNKNRFIEGKHYYRLTGEELKQFKNQINDIDLVDKRTSSLILWTDRGASRHCKILDTDKAWEQFDNLEETYFKAKHSYQIEDPIERAKQWIKEQEQKKLLEKKIQEQQPYVDLVKERIAKGEKISLTDVTESLGLKRGQISNYLKENGYLHKTRTEVNKKGKGMFAIYKEGNFNCIGVLEKGIDFINKHLEEIKQTKARKSKKIK